ncbi:MAG: 1-hydroxycarotenoid 3,4-desaturase CrtD [Pseudomonadota bacterium]
MSKHKRVVVIGAGAGGLAAAMDLSAAGLDVTLIERAADVGGKMRKVDVGGARVDAGPTVFTMRWIFDALFERSGAQFDAELNLTPATRLARHFWLDGSTVDLWPDIQQSADAIGEFSDARNAQGYLRFCADAQDVFRTLKDTFIDAQKPDPLTLGLRVGLHRVNALWRTRPFDTFGSRLQSYFTDPRLQQLFGRYSTYVGSSPYLTPATLMLIAHVEQDGVWLVDGGMHAVARAMLRVAERNGASVRFGTTVKSVQVERGTITGVTLDTGDVIAADTVVFNGDSSALAAGLLGDDVRPAAKLTKRSDRSLSALTWCMHAKTSGVELDYHTVFFSDGYRREFDDVFQKRKSPEEPTIYICAQDRTGRAPPTGRERLLVLVNAPPDGDQASNPAMRDNDAQHRSMVGHLARYGLELESGAPCEMTGPEGFHGLFPGTGGALYGRSNHGPFATFARPGAQSRVEGVYLAGGSTHPGAGVPMATLSGRLAAQAVLNRR